MKIIEKDFVRGEATLGTTKHYADVDPSFIPYDKDRGVRVLPAPFFHEPRLNFTLIKRYEVGDKKSFPKGGYEIRDENGGSVRSYELDQIIIHPSITKKHIVLEGDEPEKTEKASEPIIARVVGKRGRPALSPEEKAKREAAAAAKPPGTGKRGRPKMNPADKKPTPEKGPTGGKRGRKPLTPEELLKREQIKAAKAVRSGGKRGRPKKTN